MSKPTGKRVRKLADDYAWAPITCALCTKCRLYLEGPRVGTCWYGGPYKGFVKEMPDAEAPGE